MDVGMAIDLSERKTELLDKVKAILPEGGNLDLCLTCGCCVSGCPASGLEGLDPRKFLRMAVLGLDDEILSTPWVWMCTICSRCVYACPMKIDIPKLVYEVRAMWPRDKRPTGIRRSCDFHVKTGGAMGISKEDWIFVINDVLEEFRQEPGWEDLQAPIDKEGAYYCLNQNSREPVTEPEEMVPLWRILHIVGADWTYPSEMWGGENYCMFLADDKNWEYTVRTLAKKVDDLGCKVLVNTECGHSFHAMYAGLKKFNIPHRFEFKSIIELYAKWIREGKLKVNADWNKDGLKFTVQDPCKLVRQSLGDPIAEDLRFVIKKCVGEENFVDMYPNKSDNYCCGGGSGALQAPYSEERRRYGRTKFNQIMETGADIVITPCENCLSQILDLCEKYGGKYKTVHLWTVICLSLGILSEKERAYIGNIGL